MKGPHPTWLIVSKIPGMAVMLQYDPSHGFNFLPEGFECIGMLGLLPGNPQELC